MAEQEWAWVASVNSRDVVHRDEAEEKLARYQAALELIAYPDCREMALLEEASAVAREALDA